MISPYLFVGIGGSGRQTLDWLYNDLKRRLIEAGWPWAEREAQGNAMPECWQFLGIDVESNAYSGADVGVPKDAVSFLPLSRFPETISSIYSALRNQPVGLSTLGWIPPESDLRLFNPYDGAGQFRAIGRTVILAKIGEVAKTLNTAAAAVATQEAVDDLRALQQLYGETPENTRPRVVMFTSLSGGSGSGTWLEIAQWFAGRETIDAEAWMAQRSYMFCYLPEVFELISGPDQGIAPNSLYGVSEFLSACANRGPIDAISAPLAATMGIYSTGPLRRSPGNVFFIGRRNSGQVEFKQLDHVYSTVAQTVAALVSGSSASDFERISVNANSNVRVPLLDRYDVPSSNLGYSRLELGRRAFASYAHRRLLRETTIRLTRGFHAFRGNRLESDEQLVARLVAQHSDDFFTRCKLNERDVDRPRNQILNGLLVESRRDSVLQERSASFWTNAVGWVKFKADDLKIALTEDLKNRTAGVSDDVSADILKNAVNLAESIRSSVLVAVVDYSTEYSVPVTIGLLKSLKEQLTAAKTQLRLEYSTAEATMASAQNEIFSRLSKRGALDSDQADGEVAEDLKVLLRSQSQVRVREVAPGFIDEILLNLIDPLTHALESWVVKTNEKLQEPQWNELLRQWNGVDTPSDLVPAPNVIRIEDTKDFPSRFAELLQQTFGQAPDSALRTAVNDIVRAVWDGAGGPIRFEQTRSTGQMFIRENAVFSLTALEEPPGSTVEPSRHRRDLVAKFLSSSTFADKAEFDVLPVTAFDDLVRHWIDYRPGRLSEYANEGLGSWLDERGDNISSRSQTFLSKFATALDRSAPLVSYSVDSMQAIHATQRPVDNLIVSPFIPLAEQRSVSASLIGQLEQGRFPEGAAQFVTERDTETLEFIRSYKEALHPLAMTSLTDAVAEMSVATEPKKWLARRSRPLSQTLPITQAQIVAFLRGWTALRVLNRIDSAKGATFIADGFVPIPRAGLRGRDPRYYAGTGDLRPSIWLRVALEGLPMAVLDYARQRKDLDWYVKVITLGGYDPDTAEAGEQDQRVNEYGVSSQEVRAAPNAPRVVTNWIETGDLPASAPTPDATLAGSSGEPPDARRAAVLGYLGDMEKMLQTATDKLFASSASAIAAPVTPELELNPHLLAALEQIRRGIESGQPDTLDVGGGVEI